jgi:iron complex outermembrane recepter protein
MKCRANLRTSTALSVVFALSGLVIAVSPALGQSEQLETITVLGVRGAEQRAIDIKRDAPSIVDSIAAEDIGKLPDSTIADSLQRIPGVQIRRDAGEGGAINIRGLPEVMVGLNGEEFLGANSITNVQPNFTDIPSQLFSGADVIKSSTADLLNAGITGTINLKTRRPLDLAEGFTVSLDAATSIGNKTHTWQPETNGLIAYHQGRFGILFSGAYSDLTLANYYNGLEGGTSWSGYKYDVTGKDYYSYVGHSAYNKTTERKRAGLNMSGQYDFGDGFELTVDGFYTHQTELNHTVGIVDENKWQDWNWFTAVDSTGTGYDTTNGSEIYTVQTYGLKSIRLKSYSEMDRFDSNSSNVNLELKYDNGGKFTGSIRAVYGNATKRDANVYADQEMSNMSNWLNSDDYATSSTHPAAGCNFYPTSMYPAGYACMNPGGYAGAPIVNIAYGSSATWSGLPASITDKNSYAIGTFSSESNYNQYANLRVIRADGKYTFSDRFNLEAGIRLNGRGARNDAYNLFSPVYGGEGATDKSGNPIAGGCYVKWHAADVVLSGGTDGSGQYCQASDGNGHFYSARGPMSLTSFGDQAIFVKDFGPAKGIPGVWALNPKTMDHPASYMENLFPGEIAVTDPGSTYAVNVSQQSGYVQGNLSGTEKFPFEANFGVRLINTDLTVTQHLVGSSVAYSGTSADLGTFTTKHSFVDILPSVNVAFNFQDDLKFRFSYAKAMNMLDLQMWGGAFTPAYKTDSNGKNTDILNASSSGNPNLKPWRSSNYQASIEWYFAQGSMLSVGMFVYKIDSFVHSETILEALPDADGVVRRTVPVSTIAQGTGGTLEGLEINYKQAFDFLPGFWSGLGIDTNYTYSPSDAGYKDVQGNTVPFQDNSVHQANVVLWYQYDGLQARLAYNFRSKRAKTQNDIWGETEGMTVYQKPAEYIDASLSYDFTPNLTGYIQGSNLGGTAETYYFQFKDQYFSQNAYERRLTVGLRARL